MGDLTPLLDRLVERLVFAIAPEAIVLFGSHAKGKPTATSDVDLLVVWDTLLPPGERPAHVVPLTADVAPRVDVVICTPGELADTVARPHSFLGSALVTGRVLHRRPGYELPSPRAGERGTTVRETAGQRSDGSAIVGLESCDLRRFIWYAIVWKTVYRSVEIASDLSGKVGSHLVRSGLHLFLGRGT